MMLDGGRGRNAKEDSFKAHRDVFFFTLQRELEKVRPMEEGISRISADIRSTHSTSSKNVIFVYDS
jgi:hypothetical protein